MNLSLSSDDEAIVESAAEALAREMPVAQGRIGMDPLTQERRGLALAASLGWMGLACAEASGGSEATIAEAALLAIELGRGLAPVPVLAGTLAARIAEAAGDVALASAIIAGERKVGLLQADGLLLGGAGASLAVRVLRDSAQVLEWGAAATIECFDPTMTLARGTPSTPLARVGGASWSLELELLIAAAQTGAAEATLNLSVAHAMLREQFGRAIGAFQAVRHKCADMALRCARARSQTLFAAVTLRDGRADAAENVLAASLVAHEAATANARTNIFIHGAQGVTAENAAHLYLKRAIVMSRAASPTHALKDALADLTGKAGKERHVA